MSEARAAFPGTYADLKFIKTRKVASITIEIPLEMAGEFVKAFGAPDPSAEIPVAIARMDYSATPEPKAIAAPVKRRWEDLTPPQQAGIRCNEIEFSKFMRTKYPDVNPLLPSTATPADETAIVLKKVLGISSRRELCDPWKADEWRKIEAQFQTWKARAT